MTNKGKPLLTMLAATLAAVVLAACGGGSDHDGGGAGASGPGNSTDAMFVNGMIPHHESAVEMAKIAQDRGEHPELKKLADEIILAQEREIGTMAPLRDKLSKEHGDAQMEGEHGMGMSEEDIGELKTAAPFDRAFIDMMVPHHESAVTMAEEELSKGENATLRKLAEDIIGAQKREIDQMRSWRQKWYGSAGASSSKGESSGGHKAPGH